MLVKNLYGHSFKNETQHIIEFMFPKKDGRFYYIIFYNVVYNFMYSTNLYFIKFSVS